MLKIYTAYATCRPNGGVWYSLTFHIRLGLQLASADTHFMLAGEGRISNNNRPIIIWILHNTKIFNNW